MTEILHRNYLKSGSYSANYIENTLISEEEARRYLDLRIQNSKAQAFKPLFAPGVLYNSIKCGLAVDYPIFSRDEGDMTGSYNAASNPAGLIGQFGSPITASGPYTEHAVVSGSDDRTNDCGLTGSMIHNNLDRGIPRISSSLAPRRITFEEMLDPARIVGTSMFDNEPHPSASLTYGNHYWESIMDRPFRFGELDKVRTSELMGVLIESDGNPNRSLLPYQMAINNFCAEVSSTFTDDGIVTFEATHPKWSFAKINEQGLVTEVAEKKPISNIATVGFYYWKQGSDFVKYAEQMINKNIRVNNEFYVCPVFNQAIEDGKEIRTFNINGMWGLGTPEDLNYYLENYK